MCPPMHFHGCHGVYEGAALSHARSAPSIAHTRHIEESCDARRTVDYVHGCSDSTPYAPCLAACTWRITRNQFSPQIFLMSAFENRCRKRAVVKLMSSDASASPLMPPSPSKSVPSPTWSIPITSIAWFKWAMASRMSASPSLRKKPW